MVTYRLNYKNAVKFKLFAYLSVRELPQSFYLILMIHARFRPSLLAQNIKIFIVLIGKLLINLSLMVFLVTGSLFQDVQTPTMAMYYSKFLKYDC